MKRGAVAVFALAAIAILGAFVQLFLGIWSGNANWYASAICAFLFGGFLFLAGSVLMSQHEKRTTKK